MKLGLLIAALPLAAALVSSAPAQLPSQSTITGPLMRGPDGTVEVAPRCRAIRRVARCAAPAGRHQRARHHHHAPDRQRARLAAAFDLCGGSQLHGQPRAGRARVARRVSRGLHQRRAGLSLDRHHGGRLGRERQRSAILSRARQLDRDGEHRPRVEVPQRHRLRHDHRFPLRRRRLAAAHGLSTSSEYAVADNPPRVYRITPNQLKGCTSGAASPKGAGGAISDGGCTWQSVTSLGYSSQASPHPETGLYPREGRDHRDGELLRWKHLVWRARAAGIHPRPERRDRPDHADGARGFHHRRQRGGEHADLRRPAALPVIPIAARPAPSFRPSYTKDYASRAHGAGDRQLRRQSRRGDHPARLRPGAHGVIADPRRVVARTRRGSRAINAAATRSISTTPRSISTGFRSRPITAPASTARRGAIS